MSRNVHIISCSWFSDDLKYKCLYIGFFKGVWGSIRKEKFFIFSPVPVLMLHNVYTTAVYDLRYALYTSAPIYRIFQKRKYAVSYENNKKFFSTSIRVTAYDGISESYPSIYIRFFKAVLDGQF